MSKINDQPMDEKKLNQKELDEVSGGEEAAYEEPEVKKAEFEDTERDVDLYCKNKSGLLEEAPWCYR